MLVARDDRVHRRIIPSTDTVEAELVFVIREGRSHVRREELGRDLPDHDAAKIARLIWSPDRNPQSHLGNIAHTTGLGGGRHAVIGICFAHSVPERVAVDTCFDT